ncbi:PH domain-containing protein [Streptomyces sp. LS1784]|uniref:PH domain-containing protein n=1 Tax=Streptomyces sp. LS1784 TaxID=2851533 RepID=UPI001CCE07C9|nr:PH domain-containing protein [Streptomyces sp. LS1784]
MNRVGWALLVLVPLAFGYGFLSWRFTRYRVEGAQLRVEHGIVFRRSRDIRLDRVQAIEVIRPLAARLLGLAVLRFDMATGEKARSTLEYLGVGQAVAFRTELLARGAGLAPEAGQAQQQVLYALSGRRLLGSIALSLSTWGWLIAAVATVVPLVTARTWAEVFAVALSLATVLSATVLKRFAAEYSFTLAESPDGMRISAGLLEYRHETVLPGRVQALRIDEPLLWRRMGWVRVRMNVAGQDAAGGSLLLPVAPRAQALALLGRLWPGLDLDAVALTPPPRRACFLAPFWAARSGLGLDAQVVVSRRGLIVRRTMIIPHTKPQSLALTQNPLTRLLGLARLHLHSTTGPVRVSARFRDLGEARTFLQTQASSAQRPSRSGPCCSGCRG